MTHFVYKAKKPDGGMYTAAHDATDRYELYRIIRDAGDELVSIEDTRVGGRMHIDLTPKFISERVKPIDKINFARNLGAMLNAGLALSRAISVIERQSHSNGLKKVLKGLIAEIDKGTTFADAAAKYPKVFPPIFVSMVHAGEQSGSLAEALKVIASQMERSYALTRRVRGALIYPAVIVVAMIGIAIIMFTFVVPTLMKTFIDLHVQLPFATQVVLGISGVFQTYGIFMLIALIAAVWGGKAWSRTLQGKRVLHFIIIKAPLFGSLVQEVNTARTARTLSSLLQAGVEVVEAVSITSAVIQNVYFKEVLVKAGLAIKKGEPMSRVFNENLNLYPVFLAEMINVGEETGKTGEMLVNVAEYYEDDVNEKTKDMSTVIEPIIMIVIAAAVGFFAVAMISPMYSLVNAI